MEQIVTLDKIKISCILVSSSTTINKIIGNIKSHTQHFGYAICNALEMYARIFLISWTADTNGDSYWHEELDVDGPRNLFFH